LTDRVTRHSQTGVHPRVCRVPYEIEFATVVVMMRLDTLEVEFG